MRANVAEASASICQVHGPFEPTAIVSLKAPDNTWRELEQAARLGGRGSGENEAQKWLRSKSPSLRLEPIARQGVALQLPVLLAMCCCITCSSLPMGKLGSLCAEGTHGTSTTQVPAPRKRGRHSGLCHEHGALALQPPSHSVVLHAEGMKRRACRPARIVRAACFTSAEARPPHPPGVGKNQQTT